MSTSEGKPDPDDEEIPVIGHSTLVGWKIRGIETVVGVLADQFDMIHLEAEPPAEGRSVHARRVRAKTGQAPRRLDDGAGRCRGSGSRNLGAAARQR